MNSGTWTTTPDSSVAGLVPPPDAVSPLTPGLGRGHLHVDGARHLHVAGPLVDEEDVDLVVGEDPAHRLGGELAGDLDLLVVAAVHEHRRLTRVVEVLHLARLGPHRPELLAGAKGLVDHRAVGDLAQLGAHERPALAGLDVLKLEDPVDRPVDLDVTAVLELVGGDHGGEG